MSTTFTGSCNLPTAQQLPSRIDHQHAWAEGKTIEPQKLVSTDVNFKRTVVELPLERCGFQTTDPAEFEAHIKTVHGRSPRPTNRLPRWRAPKPKDNPAALALVDERLTPITWTEDGLTLTGQYWSDGPHKDSMWVLPNEPREDGASAVLLRLRNKVWQFATTWKRPSQPEGQASRPPAA